MIDYTPTIKAMADREMAELDVFIRDRFASVSRMANPKALKIDADSWMFEQLKKAELRDDLRFMAQEIARLTTCPMLPLMQAH